MATADDPAPCPNGHDDTVRLLPTVAVTGVSKSGGSSGMSGFPTSAAGPSAAGGGAGGGGGGCCGGGCCG
jgi:hypothetical protein